MPAPIQMVEEHLDEEIRKASLLHMHFLATDDIHCWEREREDREANSRRLEALQVRRAALSKAGAKQ